MRHATFGADKADDTQHTQWMCDATATITATQRAYRCYYTVKGPCDGADYNRPRGCMSAKWEILLQTFSTLASKFSAVARVSRKFALIGACTGPSTTVHSSRTPTTKQNGVHDSVAATESSVFVFL